MLVDIGWYSTWRFYALAIEIGMGGGTGGGDGGTGPPQTFHRLTLCLRALHGKNRLQMAIAPPPPQSSRRGAALGWHCVPRSAAFYSGRQRFLGYVFDFRLTGSVFSP